MTQDEVNKSIELARKYKLITPMVFEEYYRFFIIMSYGNTIVFHKFSEFLEYLVDNGYITLNEAVLLRLQT